MSIIEKNLIGIDLGSATIKFAQQTGHGLMTAMADLPEGVLEGLVIKDSATFVALLQAIRKEYRFNGKRCALTLGKRDVLVRRAELPIMDPKPMRDNVLTEFAGYLPRETDEYLIDYREMDLQPTAGSAHLLMAAVLREPIKALLAVLKQAGFDIQYLDVCENVRAKLIAQTEDDLLENICFLDIGHTVSQFVLFHAGRYSLSKTIMGGGLSFTTALENELGCGMEEAESMKRRRAILEDVSVTGSLALRERVDGMITEIQRVLDYFANRTREQVSRICLLGGGAQLIGLPSYLQEVLRAKVEYSGEWLAPVGGTAEDVRWTDAIGAMLREEGKG